MYSVADAYQREESILGRRSDEARANIHTEQLFLILFHIHNLCPFASPFIYHYLNRHQQKLQCPDQLKKLEKMEGTLGLQGRQRRQRVKVLWILIQCQRCASFNLNKTVSAATVLYLQECLHLFLNLCSCFPHWSHKIPHVCKMDRLILEMGHLCSSQYHRYVSNVFLCD